MKWSFEALKLGKEEKLKLWKRLGQGRKEEWSEASSGDENLGWVGVEWSRKGKGEGLNKMLGWNRNWKMKNKIVVRMLSEIEDELFSRILSRLEDMNDNKRRTEGES